MKPFQLPDPDDRHIGSTSEAVVALIMFGGLCAILVLEWLL